MFVQGLGAETYLKLLELQDAGEVFALTEASRDHLRRWLPWVDSTRTVAESEAFIASTLEQFARGLGFQAGIWRGETLCGVVGMHPIDRANRQGSIGYWIGAAYEGQGLVTLASRAVLAEAFGHYGLHRMEIRAATGNARSRAVAERLGFTREGVVRDAEWLYDRYVDHVVFGMLEEEWRRAGRREGE